MNRVEQMKRAKAIRVTESLVSPQPSIKLPSYAAEGKGQGPSYVTWDGAASLDSVQSQANRIEAVFANYPDLVPATQVTYPDATIPLVDVPHRAADPAISAYFRTELDSLNNPELLAKRAPTSLVFGICDIRNGRNIKVNRAITAEVIVRNAVSRPTASSLSTPFSNETRAEFAEKLAEHGLKGSEIGVEQVPTYHAKGTLDANGATIERTVVLSLDILDKYKKNPVLYEYLVGLALIAVLSPTTSVLRSGTTLVRQSRKVEVFADLKPVEAVDESGLFEEVLAYARHAAATFGVGQAETLTVDIERIIADATSGNETKKAVKAKKAISGSGKKAGAGA
jgi:hypothetical protein